MKNKMISTNSGSSSSAEQEKLVDSLKAEMQRAEKDYIESKKVKYKGPYASVIWLVWMPFLVATAAMIWLVSDCFISFIYVCIASVIFAIIASIVIKIYSLKRIKAISDDAHAKEIAYLKSQAEYNKEYSELTGMLAYGSKAGRGRTINVEKEKDELKKTLEDNQKLLEEINRLKSEIEEERAKNARNQLLIEENERIKKQAEESLRSLETARTNSQNKSGKIGVGSYLKHSIKGLCRVERLTSKYIDVRLLEVNGVVKTYKYPDSIGKILFVVSDEEVQKCLSDLEKEKTVKPKDYSFVPAGTRVESPKLGKGSVVSCDGRYVFVVFDKHKSELKRFAIPSSFTQKYLRIIE